MISKYKVKKETELLALANEQKEERKIYLAEWVLGKSSKVRNELINSTWGMRDVAKTLERQNMPRMETVQDFKTKDCVSGFWVESAKELLKNNGIHAFMFGDDVRSLLVGLSSDCLP